MVAGSLSDCLLNIIRVRTENITCSKLDETSCFHCHMSVN